MIPLAPADKDLDWKAVERNFADIVPMAEKIWRDAGILMPDDAATELQLTAVEELFTLTAVALEIDLAVIYGMRERLRWFTFTDTPGRWRIYASLDGGPPQQLLDRANEAGGIVECNWPSYRQ